MGEKIILVKTDTIHGKRIHPPLGLLYVGGALKKAGYNVEIMHLTYDEIDRCVDLIVRKDPLFVGFSVITGPPTLYSAVMSRKIKERSDLPILWGGTHPSLIPNQCLNESYIDTVVIGEGELTAIEFAKKIEKDQSLKKVKGIGYKERGKPVINERRPFIKNLDDFRMDFDLINIKRYLYELWGCKRVLSYISSRGCPYACSFCYNQVFNKRRWRPFSINTVIDDISYLKSEYDIDGVRFFDDNFFPDMRRALEILERIKLPTHAEIRVDYITHNVARKLKELCCKTLFIGAESGSDRILRLMNKGFLVSDTVRAVQILSEHHIEGHYSFILGTPTETKKELFETTDLIYHIHKTHKEGAFTVGHYLPYPGVPLYDLAIQYGFIPPQKTEDWYVLDRHDTKINLPYIDIETTGSIEKLSRVLAFHVTPLKKLCEFRLKHKMFLFPYDVKFALFLQHHLDKRRGKGEVFEPIRDEAIKAIKVS